MLRIDILTKALQTVAEKLGKPADQLYVQPDGEALHVYCSLGAMYQHSFPLAKIAREEGGELLSVTWVHDYDKITFERSYVSDCLRSTTRRF